MTGVLPVEVPVTSLDTAGETSLSESERAAISRRLNAMSPVPKTIGTDSYRRYIRPMSQEIAHQILDNKAIETLSPEVRTAQTIVIPSIISPTDMRDGKIEIQSTSTLIDRETNEKISKVFDKHFNDKLKLSQRLPDWIHDVLYGAGSRPLMVLPITELDTIMNDPTAIIGKDRAPANEALKLYESLDKLSDKSIFGIADSAVKKPESKDTIIASMQPAVESYVLRYVDTAPLEVKAPKDSSKKAESSYNVKWAGDEFKNFAESALESVSIIDNVDVMKSDKIKKQKKDVELKKQLVNHYKIQTTITINPESGESKGDPVVYELPPESVIPVFTPGAPSDHIGYFIAIDEYGNPLHMTGDVPIPDFSDNRRVNPGALYRSFGIEDHFLVNGGGIKKEQAQLMVGVYQTIIDAHLKGRLRDTGFSDVYIGTSENIYRCMFSRYLQARKTKLLFVPRDMMTYMCFRYNPNGTGRSKLEDVKFILSLKITVLICRMMAAMNSSINRKKINIDFTENMGDPIQFMELVKKEAIDKSIVNFSWDPADISRTIAQRSLTVVAKGIPGAENFQVSTEPNEVRDIRPDETLIEDLSNMMILGLDVPPSAMNLLSENEFSRSVATNNLFFSRRIMHYQAKVCDAIARHVRVYTSMSKTLKDEIMEILNSGVSTEYARANLPTEPTETEDDKTKDTTQKKSRKAKDKTRPDEKDVDETTKPDDGTVDDKDKPPSADVKFIDVLRNVKAVLPSPDMAPNKAEFEELNAIISAVGAAIDSVYENDLGAADDDNPMAFIRAIAKSDVVRQYIKKIGIARDVELPEFNASLVDDAIKQRLYMLNMSKGLKDVKAKTTPADVEPTDTGGQTF